MTASQVILGSFFYICLNIDITQKEHDLKHKCNLRNLKNMFPV